MGRAPCCDKANVKKGPWSPEEDAKLKDYIHEHGTGGNWISLPQKAGLRRCGKSCRLRWLNYLRPNIKHGEFSDDEDRIICTLFATIGSRWSIIAGQLPGRTYNDIKNYWNTKLKKKMFGQYSHHHHPNMNNSFLTDDLLQSSSSPSLLYNCSSSSGSYHHTPAATYNSSSFSGLMGPTPMEQQQQYYQVQDGVQMINGGNGTEAASCSSSDGSYYSNQISYGGDHQQQLIGMQSYSFYTEADDDDLKQKLVIIGSSSNEWSDDQKPAVVPTNEVWGETPLDYGLEEIKHLISTSSSCNNNNNSFINFYENKAEEKVMYY